MKRIQLTAIIQREGDGYVALCPELDIASQGESKSEARANLQEAVEGFFEAASESEIKTRLGDDRTIENLEVSVA
jgi:predicted RNase H-like HicB family nuclease